MAGHLFITRGDITKLACDAVLVPSGHHPDGRPWHVRRERWRTFLTDRQVSVADDGVITSGSAGPPPADVEQDRVALLAGRRGKEPAVGVAHTGASRKEPSWYAAAITAFVHAAAEHHVVGAGVASDDHHRPDGDRPSVSAVDRARPLWRPLADERPLVALPLVGIGHGGMERRRGEAVTAVVRAIVEAQGVLKGNSDAQVARDVDVVLVLANEETFAAAQQARRAVLGEHAFDALGPPGSDLRRAADELAGHARRGRLVPFVGAGASIGAGLPSWDDLLSGLVEDVPSDQRSAIANEIGDLDARDQGAVLETVLGREKLVDGIVRATSTPQVSLLHQILASLPVSEVVTTNYDSCLERAFEAAGRGLESIRRTDAATERWILKLHGSVDDQANIVLSRGDYLRFEGEGSALAGVVQAMLLTRHLLFVGYSLSDDNFHRLVHQTQYVTGSRSKDGGRPARATALTPDPEKVVQRVWEKDVRFVSTAREGAPPAAGDPDARKDPRRTAILLDCVAAGAFPATAHLTDDRYRALFDERERALGAAVHEVWRALEALGDETESRRAIGGMVGEALGRLGRAPVQPQLHARDEPFGGRRLSRRRH